LDDVLEQALWCNYSAASTSPKTKLVLLKVKLGLPLGFGGTQNLDSLVGLQAAMYMMVTVKDMHVDKAMNMGLVDLVVDGAALESEANGVMEQMADGSGLDELVCGGHCHWLEHHVEDDFSPTCRRQKEDIRDFEARDRFSSFC